MEQDMNYNDSFKAKRAVSSAVNMDDAVREIKEQLGENDYSFVMFFASPIYPPEISKKIQEAFANVRTFGCTTAGEVFGGELLQNSVVAMGFDKNIINNYYFYLINDINEVVQVNKIFQDFSQKTKTKISEFDFQKYVGILITEGLTGCPEKIMTRINEITEIPFIGGAAADNWELKHTYIYADGKYYENAAFMLFLEPLNGYKTLKTQSFEPVGEVFIITEADEEKRCIKTINNEPAALFYARQIGVSIEELRSNFANYSIGHIVYNEAFSHDSKDFDENYNLYLYSPIPEGAEIQILKITNIIEDFQNIIEQEITPLKNISAIIHFNCASRDMKIRQDNMHIEHKDIFGDLPIIGFATYGEFYISFINQTSTVLILF